MKLPILIDLDGVLRIGRTPAPGLSEFFGFLKAADLKACILSNSTLSNAAEVMKYFDSVNIECPVPIITSADAAYNFAKENYRNVRAYCAEPVRQMFAKLKSDGKVDAVVIGDFGDKWNFSLMNEIFLHVINGADIIAMQINRFWTDPERGKLLDVGPFVKAIEYASEKKAMLIGKPSPLYFESALKVIGENIDSPFLMLGDDLETDIAGSQNCGGKGILIYTGKTTRMMKKTSSVKPDFEVENLFEVIELLEGEIFI